MESTVDRVKEKCQQWQEKRDAVKQELDSTREKARVAKECGNRLLHARLRRRLNALHTEHVELSNHLDTAHKKIQQYMQHYDYIANHSNLTPVSHGTAMSSASTARYMDAGASVLHPAIRDVLVHSRQKDDATRSITARQQRVEMAQRVAKQLLEDLKIDDPTLESAEDTQCPMCGGAMQVLPFEPTMKCSVCMYSTTFLDATSSAMEYTMTSERSSMTRYERLAHFLEFMKKLQYKESMKVPTEPLVKVMDELKARGIKTAAEIHVGLVRDVVRGLRLSKYYDHITQIYCRISGAPPPQIDKENEQKLRCMFIAIQEPFERVKHDRRNFLAYSFVTFKLCELLGLHHILPFISLLKTKNHQHDAMWKGMCKILNWKFMPTVINVAFEQKKGERVTGQVTLHQALTHAGTKRKLSTCA